MGNTERIQKQAIIAFINLSPKLYLNIHDVVMIIKNHKNPMTIGKTKV
jgi:hypothetical protein